MEEIKLQLEDNRIIKIKEGTTFKNVIDEYFDDKDILLCELEGIYYELSLEIPSSGKLKTINSNSSIGWKIYARTLQFIFIKVVKDMFKDVKITMEHSISKGIFGEIMKETLINEEEILKIKEKMKDLIKRDVPIKRTIIKKDYLEENIHMGQMEKSFMLFEQRDAEEIKLYELEGIYDYFYGEMAYSTGIIRAFDLITYEHGFILRNPPEGNVNVVLPFKEEKKLAKIFYETKEWLSIIGIENISSLNEKIINKDLKDTILVSEALHEKKIAYIADEISSKEDIKVVLIAGPSSSGKTTFANRLGIQLRVNGLNPIPISLDDYFLSREFTPRDEDGNYDFESIYSIDLKLFNNHLKKLLNGEEVEIPGFNFLTGQREWSGKKFMLPERGVLVIEGIHGLNPILTSEIDSNNKFKIYISALTQLNFDDHNRIATTDVRKIRRIVRDYLSRGYGAEETLKMWPAIKKGEKENIFIFQEEADVMFNSTLVYELSVLKSYALKELDKIKPKSPVYYEAVRLKCFLSFFKEIEFSRVPENSILREFMGGSCFYIY
ncbi:nucleoside kinase [Clostridium vincentii]|uniref:Threonine--tRNA ligase n=1 Tax=Clostridium vincentii TaxID=52704 RepID=A0A2T0BL74_9CLOT|nr:nucleoside kinase [Clostridium vincentii]PRR84631.1 Threonine--tRNA ligase [Clostridium vincentii]